MKRKIIIICILLLVFIPFFWIAKGYYCNVYSKRKYVENCYMENKQSFELIADNFKKLYEKSLYSSKYYLDTNTLVKDNAGKKESFDCKNESFNEVLTNLKNKYQKDADCNIFSSVHAYYDNAGNMLLFFIVNNQKNGDKIRNHYLVYIDQTYQGHNSDLGIDKYDNSTDPFYENWYYWSNDVQTG